MKKYLLILLGVCLFAACSDDSEKREEPQPMTPENSTPVPMTPNSFTLDASEGGVCTIHTIARTGEKVPTVFEAAYTYNDSYPNSVLNARYKDEELPAVYDCGWYTVTQLDSFHYEIAVLPSNRPNTKLKICIAYDRRPGIPTNVYWCPNGATIELK